MLHGLTHKTAVGLWLFAVLMLPTHCASAQSSGERLLQSAHSLLARELDEQAAAEYQDAIDNLDNAQQAAEARYGLAIAFQRMGREDDAIKALTAIPEDFVFGFRTDTDVLLATLLARNSNEREAIRAAERVLDQPDHASWPGIASLHIELLHRRGRHPEAMRSFQDNRERLEDRDASAFTRAALFAGLAALQLAESSAGYASAAEILEHSVSEVSEPEVREHGLLMIATAWQQAEQGDQAEQSLRRAVEDGNARTEASARLGLGALLRTESRFEEAIEMLEGIDRSELARASRARVDLELGLARLESGDARRAARSLDRVLDSDATDLLPTAAYWRAKADLRRERFGDAIAGFESTQDRFPESPLAAESAYDLGIAHQRAGHAAEAAHAFEAFRSQWPDHPLVQQAHLAELSIAMDTGPNDRAIALAQEFLRLYQHSERAPNATLSLSEAFFNAGRFSEAAERVGPLVSNEDTTLSQRAALLLGLALQADGRSVEALPVLTETAQSLSENPVGAPVHLAIAQIHANEESWADARDAAATYLRVAPDQDPRRSSARLLMGIAFARLDARADAIEALKPLLETDDDDILAQACLELGQLYEADGSIRRARELFEQVVAEHSESRYAPYALRLLASIAAEAGETDKAESLYARAASSAQGTIAEASRLDRARVLLAAGRDAEAAEVLQSASDGVSLAWRVVALGRSGEHADASALARKVDRDELPGDLSDAFTYQFADSERELGNTPHAVELLQSLLDSSRLSGEAALQLAELAIEQDDLPTAVARLERAIEQTSDGGSELCASIRYQLAWCRYQLDEPRRVVELLEELPCDPGPLAVSTALLLGEAYASLERNADASNQFAFALEHGIPEKQQGPTLLRLGQTSAAAQDWGTSKRAFAQHRKQHAQSATWYIAEFGVGWATENEGRHEEAIRHYRAVIDDHRGETAARAQFQIGECLFALGRHEEAIRELLRVDTMYEHPAWSAAALFEAGRCFEAMNKVGEARSQYRLVLDQHADSHWAEAAAERLRTIAAPGGS